VETGVGSEMSLVSGIKTMDKRNLLPWKWHKNRLLDNEKGGNERGAFG
jgi:hypothetical protein